MKPEASGEILKITSRSKKSDWSISVEVTSSNSIDVDFSWSFQATRSIEKIIMAPTLESNKWFSLKLSIENEEFKISMFPHSNEGNLIFSSEF